MAIPRSDKHAMKWGYSRNHNPNLFCPGQRAATDAYRQGYDETFASAKAKCAGCEHFSEVLSKCFKKGECEVQP